MLIIQHHGSVEPVSYKHVINPIKTEKGFEPNWEEYKKIKATSQINALKEDFEKHQKNGKIIIVNFAGGWCFLTYGIDILQGKELINQELLED